MNLLELSTIVTVGMVAPPWLFNELWSETVWKYFEIHTWNVFQPLIMYLLMLRLCWSSVWNKGCAGRCILHTIVYYMNVIPWMSFRCDYSTSWSLNYTIQADNNGNSPLIGHCSSKRSKRELLYPLTDKPNCSVYSRFWLSSPL